MWGRHTHQKNAFRSAAVLGGGSSDAATTLVALNEIWQTGCSVDDLAALGLELGADVPVFVRGHSAWAAGHRRNPDPASLPGIGTSSSSMRGSRCRRQNLFQAAELTRNSPPATISGYFSGAPAGQCFCAGRTGARYPGSVAAALDWLGQFGEARLSGSGGCVFIAVDSQEQAAAIRRDMSCTVRRGHTCARGVDLLRAIAGHVAWVAASARMTGWCETTSHGKRGARQKSRPFPPD